VLEQRIIKSIQRGCRKVPETTEPAWEKSTACSRKLGQHNLLRPVLPVTELQDCRNTFQRKHVTEKIKK
jgi:hypothetical protein